VITMACKPTKPMAKAMGSKKGGTKKTGSKKK
jgi:hypothetical protein